MTTDTKVEKSAQPNKYPSYAPRFWHGMRVATWLSLLARNRFRVSLDRLYIAIGVSIFCCANDLLGWLQAACYGRRIKQSRLKHDPVFILGHWRSGTTLLHELLVLDPRFTYPTTYQCFAPWHFLISEWAFQKFGGFLLPKKRPMDEMAAGWDLPQEDEFALMVMGVPTPYLRIAFPQAPPPAMEYFDMVNVPANDRLAWRDRLSWFLQAIALRNPDKRLVLKSPPHTGRVQELFEMFPNAKFIHLSRDPRKLFYSTLRLWRSLDEVQGLQSSCSDERRQEYVWDCLNQMYAAYDKQSQLIPEGQLINIRYEDLVADPMTSLANIYEKLQLGDFSAVTPQLEKRLENHNAYRTNRHETDPATEQEILRRWHDYATRFGYLEETHIHEEQSR